jgi:hypothetical protein
MIKTDSHIEQPVLNLTQDVIEAVSLDAEDANEDAVDEGEEGEGAEDAMEQIDE